MGRKPITIDKAELQKNTTETEEKFHPKNHTELWELLSKTDWAISHNYKSGTLKKYAKIYEIQLQTAKGSKGNITNLSKSPPPRRKKLIVIENPEYYHKKYDKSLGEGCINKFLSGSMTAAVKINCYECSGYSKIAVSNCHITTCPMWNHRPWQKSSIDEDSVSNENIN
jgi:hypothetical protein